MKIENQQPPQRLNEIGAGADRHGAKADAPTPDETDETTLTEATDLLNGPNAGKVEELKRLHEQGRYGVSSNKIAAALIREHES